MLDVRRQVVRWGAALVVLALVTVPTGASAAPATPGEPAQSEPSDDERGERLPADYTLAEIDVLVSTDAGAVTTALADLGSQVADQLANHQAAQAAVTAAHEALATADNDLTNIQFLIDEQTTKTDAVVIDAFITPPQDSALEVLSAETPVDATIKQTLLDLQADKSAEELTGLQETLHEYEALRTVQEDARDAAEAAKTEAEASLADLEAALGQQAQFVTQVQTALATQAAAAPPADPAIEARTLEIATALDAAAAAKEIADAQRAAEEARQRKINEGIMFCPVDGNVSFVDSWGAPRSGGRTHKGVDMMASRGTPTVAPVSGEVVHRGSSLGGLSWYVYGDNGHMYYGTHLSGYANQGAGWVEAGTLIGYVGDTGNAAGNPHLHFEYHPGGGAPVNPYPQVAAAC
jgi:murein DD-endopeptidase MepM/ murein hydrolase activator NlpD